MNYVKLFCLNMFFTNFLEHHIKYYSIISFNKSHILTCCTFENTNRILMDFFDLFKSLVISYKIASFAKYNKSVCKTL